MPAVELEVEDAEAIENGGIVVLLAGEKHLARAGVVDLKCDQTEEVVKLLALPPRIVIPKSSPPRQPALLGDLEQFAKLLAREARIDLLGLVEKVRLFLSASREQLREIWIRPAIRVNPRVGIVFQSPRVNGSVGGQN